MGSGASSALATSIEKATDSDIIESLRGLSTESHAKLLRALDTSIPSQEEAAEEEEEEAQDLIRHHTRRGSINAEQPDHKAAESFSGGHEENRAAMADPFEFAKTHGEPARLEAAISFYKFANDNELWRGLVPKLIRLDTIDGRQFLVLSNMLGGLQNAVIADFKLGTQSWPVGASEEKIAKMEKRDAGSTTPLLGLRVVSAMLPKGDGPEAGYLPSGRVAVKHGLDESDWRAGKNREDVVTILGTFLGSPDLRKAFIEKLQPFVSAFKTQTEYSFIGSSLLVCYDHCKGSDSLDMRLIDFGHAHGGQNKIDEGVLKGLLSLGELVGSS